MYILSGGGAFLTEILVRSIKLFKSSLISFTSICPSILSESRIKPTRLVSRNSKLSQHVAEVFVLKFGLVLHPSFITLLLVGGTICAIAISIDI